MTLSTEKAGKTGESEAEREMKIYLNPQPGFFPQSSWRWGKKLCLVFEQWPGADIGLALALAPGLGMKSKLSHCQSWARMTCLAKEGARNQGAQERPRGAAGRDRPMCAAQGQHKGHGTAFSLPPPHYLLLWSF